MLPLDVARCSGTTSVRGKPLPCCIKCERRIWPAESVKALTFHEYVPDQIRRDWVCSGFLPYPAPVSSSRCPRPTLSGPSYPAGASNGPAGSL